MRKGLFFLICIRGIYVPEAYELPAPGEHCVETNYYPADLLRYRLS